MKVAIVGVGHVGATLAYSLLELESVTHLALIGRNQQRLEGEAMDLRHASSLLSSHPEITFGSLEDCNEVDIAVLCLSVVQESTDRDSMAVDNARLFAEVVPKLAAQSPEAILLVATNPVEALTQHAIELSGFPPHRVIGAGTVIDTCRFRLALSERLEVHTDDVRAYILGEHGVHQFAWLSGASVGGVRLQPESIPPGAVELARSAGVDIFLRKGHTSYAIAQALKLITHSIATNSLQTMPVSTQVTIGEIIQPICLAIPCIMGRRGVSQILKPEFTAIEAQQWLECAHHVAGTLDLIRKAAAR